jgi:DNA ligase D-like protein (predicted 3'-phosphoesterase)
VSIFVIHEHWASNHHFDLRLEMNKVLKSWTVPKSPLEANKRKILAIQVEDHALSYANFEGIIPEGFYGAGKVKIWDKGNYNLIEKTEKKIVFLLNGKKLKGKYGLIKFKDKNWLFFKVKE